MDLEITTEAFSISSAAKDIKELNEFYTTPYTRHGKPYPYELQHQCLSVFSGNILALVAELLPMNENIMDTDPTRKD